MSVSLSSVLPATTHLRTALQTGSFVMPDPYHTKQISKRQKRETDKSHLIHSPLKKYNRVSRKHVVRHTADDSALLNILVAPYTYMRKI